MNALASDQAQRTARAIWDNPGLKGRVTAGLYVGHDSEDALDQPVKAMERDKVITCRYTLRENPPDILLTNYKMLDFLLLRPADRELWRYNTPDTLKYLVVDELHTFDGAQGTDLSCLLRRLKSRLAIPSGHLCCVGTSATLGEKENAPDVLGYAASVFGEPFDADALITEERLSAGEFLENDMAVRFDLPDPGETVTWTRNPSIRPLNTWTAGVPVVRRRGAAEGRRER
jgi:DEAD/DEAH box helicase domain-containing protein